MDTSAIANNIKFYRKFFNMSQSELAEKIGLTRTAIANYETGKRPPDIQTLKLIANCFGITVESFYESNEFDKNISIKNFFATENELFEFVSTVMFPIVCSEVALKDDLFKEAYNKHKHMLLSPYKITLEEMINIYNLYYESFEENHTDESAGNMLSILLLIFCLLCEDDKIIELSEEILKKGVLNSYFIKKHLVKANTQESKKEKRKEYYNNYRENYFALLEVLRKNIKLRDFADYYFALSYQIGFYDNSSGVEANKLIFNELIFNYAEMENQYAIDYLRKLCDFLK